MEHDVPTSRIVIDDAMTIGQVDPRIYGSFVEHMGRCVYDGLYSPDHDSADEDGFRTDVADMVRELGPTILRYPGGNFVSGYNWEDGVGPRDERPVRLDRAWKSIETNQVGTNEFLAWCKRMDIEPMMAVNLGSRGIDEACNLLEYVNHPGGTQWSDLRRQHGYAEPHDVKVWCLGNEMDGPWQIGHKTAYEYGRLAKETAVAMRRVDPTIELVAAGTSKPIMPTFGTWEATVLEEAYEHVDYLSMHMYVDPDLTDDVPTLLASGVEIDAYIESVIASVDYARAVGRHTKAMPLSFDEWNVWYNSRPREIGVWPHAPELIGDIYTHADALVVGSFINSILRRADRIHMAALAQLVNVIAPIRTEPNGGAAWKQTSFYPFALASQYGRGVALRAGVETAVHSTSRHDDVPALDVAAVRSDDGVAVLFVVNRLAEPVRTSLAIGGVKSLGDRDVRLEITELTSASPKTTNSVDRPDAVAPRTRSARGSGGAVDIEFAPMSWSMVRVLPVNEI